MNKEVDLGEYEEIDESIKKHLKDNPDIDLLGEEEEY
jgi:hypothetical protein